jgi:hypothetical protein
MPAQSAAQAVRSSTCSSRPDAYTMAVDKQPESLTAALELARQASARG